MFKTSEEIIVIQAEATTDIPTGVVFWSHDKGTAKMLFQLQKDYVNQTLSEGTIVPICLDFVGGRHIYHAVIEDAINGIVSIVLEDNILGYVGRVTGSIYIELPDSRSLDTAGRFTFDIKRSPIDLNTPELEDYYWQGFNEIIDEYHQTINTIKSEAKALIDSLTADVTEVKNDIATANVKIAEIRKKLDDNDVFTKAESSANVIYQLIGKEKVRLTFRIDLTGKVAGSDVENANRASFRAGATLFNPSQFTADSYINYPNLYSLDGNVQRGSDSTQGNIAQMCFSTNIIEELKRLLGETFFIDQGATDLKTQIDVLKKRGFEVNYHVHGYGSYPLGNLINTAWWLDDKKYSIGRPGNGTNQIKDITTRLDSLNFPRAISSDGYVHFIAYGGPSDGITPSTITTDYVSLDFTIDLSVNEHIKSMIAANHVENLATQAEAEAGEDNTKTMTPLRVFQSIAQWTKNKFISLTENETVLGIKNFANGLQVGGNNVLSQNGEIRFVTNSTNNSSLESGSIVFKRYGDDVDIYANFQVRASGDLTRDMNIVAESIVDDIFEPGENFSFFVGSETAQAVVKFVGKGIKAHSTLTKGIWYVGTASYKAKNKL
ncbi:BppU family phage baseplate upper protein [Enterococcus avium]|uniref:BppU family phage baseplate upper protein n=1 Tax=Enterococcus avium TaxID=33945 RepID=UPI003D0AA996